MSRSCLRSLLWRLLTGHIKKTILSPARGGGIFIAPSFKALKLTITTLKAKANVATTVYIQSKRMVV
jgi:hypothetical protein